MVAFLHGSARVLSLVLLAINHTLPSTIIMTVITISQAIRDEFLDFNRDYTLSDFNLRVCPESYSAPVSYTTAHLSRITLVLVVIVTGSS